MISISNEQYAQSSYRVDRDQVRRARSTRRWRDLSSKEAATRAVSPVRFQHNHDHHHVRRIDHHAADELMVNGAVYQNDKKLDKAPRLSISIVIWILSSDTETSAATPLGGGARKVLAK